MIRTLLEHVLGASAYWQRSLKTRVTLLTLAIFVGSIWTLAAYSSNALREDMQHQLGKQQFATVSAAAADINDELTQHLRVLSVVAGGITPAMLENSKALRAYLQERLIIREEFNAGAVAIGPLGTVLAESMATGTRLGGNFAELPHIASALRDGKSGMGQPLQPRPDGHAEFGMAVPIRDSQGQVIGALAGLTDLGKPNFLDAISSRRYGDTGGYLLNAPQQRLVVTATDKSRVMQPLPAAGVNAMLDRYMQGFEGYGVTVNARGVEELTSAKGIPASGWFLAIVIPTAEAFAPVRVLRQRVLVSAVVLMLLAGALVWWMLRHQLAPLQASTVALARQLKSGQAAQALPVFRDDEIGALIAAFNQLLDTLRENELRYRTVANFTVDWEYWIMPDGALRYVSPSCQQISGYSAEQLYADPQLLRRMVHPDDMPLFDGHTHQLSSSGTPLPIDFRIRTQDGENALDLALRKALMRFFPEIKDVHLKDFKVRILDSKDGSAAKTRVLIESGDGNETWGTVGVSENIIEASWEALVDSVEYILYKKAKQKKPKKT
jgi:PAS domain-containing protein